MCLHRGRLVAKAWALLLAVRLAADVIPFVEVPEGVMLRELFGVDHVVGHVHVRLAVF